MRITRALFYFTAASLLLSILALVLTRADSELHGLFMVLRLRLGSDSSRFMGQAWDTLRSGRPLYQTLFFTQHVKFIYPTSSLLLYWFADAAHIPVVALVKLIVLFSLAGTLYFAGQVFVHKSSEQTILSSLQRRQLRIMVALLGLLFYPLVYGVSIGQIQTLLTFLWTLALCFWITNRKSLAGLAIAFICVFKPTLALFVVWAALRREWRFLACLSGASFAVQIASVALFGWRNELDYIAVLRFVSHHGEAFIPNQTINGLLHRLIHNGNMSVWSDTIYPPYDRVVYLGTSISSVLILLFGLLAPVLARWRDRSLDLILFVMLSTVASPIAWEHHYGYFFVCALYLFASIPARQRVRQVVLAVSYLILGTSWVSLDYLAGSKWTILLNFDLASGLAIIAVTVWEIARPVTTGRDKLVQSDNFDISGQGSAQRFSRP